MSVTGWIAGAAWGGLVALAAGAFADQDGPHIRVSSSGRAVWVTLNQPAAQPDRPPAPGARVQAARSYIDVHPDSAAVEVDGHSVGQAYQFVAFPLSLAPGIHHVDITYPGFKPIRTVVEVSGPQVYLLRAMLEPAEAAVEASGGSYVVVSRP
jgi:hypothetical protein